MEENIGIIEVVEVRETDRERKRAFHKKRERNIERELIGRRWFELMRYLDDVICS